MGQTHGGRMLLHREHQENIETIPVERWQRAAHREIESSHKALPQIVV